MGKRDRIDRTQRRRNVQAVFFFFCTRTEKSDTTILAANQTIPNGIRKAQINENFEKNTDQTTLTTDEQMKNDNYSNNNQTNY